MFARLFTHFVHTNEDNDIQIHISLQIRQTMVIAIMWIFLNFITKDGLFVIYLFQLQLYIAVANNFEFKWCLVQILHHSFVF